MPENHFADVYFGNSPVRETVDGRDVYTFRTTLPGTEPEHACGDDELSLPLSNFFEPEEIGPGCEPTKPRYVILKKRLLIPINTPIYVITAKLGLRQLRASIWNHLELGEHWYARNVEAEFSEESSSEWFYLTPEGDLFHWNKGQDGLPDGELVTFVGPEVYLDPKRLLPPS